MRFGSGMSGARMIGCGGGSRSGCAAGAFSITWGRSSEPARGTPVLTTIVSKIISRSVFSSRRFNSLRASRSRVVVVARSGTRMALPASIFSLMRRSRSCSSCASASAILAGSSNMFHQFDLRHLIKRLFLARGNEPLSQDFNHPIEFVVSKLTRHTFHHQLSGQQASNNLHVIARSGLQQNFESGLTFGRARPVCTDWGVPVGEHVLEHMRCKRAPGAFRAAAELTDSVAGLKGFQSPSSFAAAK